jgi:DNA-binding protein HU-beta
MNRQELIRAVAGETGLTQAKADEALKIVIERLISTLKKGETVTLVGFGTFKAADRKARKGRNPQTGATLIIAARKAPRFIPGKGFKDALNK